MSSKKRTILYTCMFCAALVICAAFNVINHFGGPREFLRKVDHRISSVSSRWGSRKDQASPLFVTVGVTVDTGADRHPISPYIYGMGMAPHAYVSDLRLALNRWGGNDKSRYNWVQGNAENAARDWGWRNRPAMQSSSPGPSSAADRFISGNRDSGAASLITIPTLGWVARDANTSCASVNVPAAGAAPVTLADGPIAGYDPSANRLLTSVRSAARKGSAFVDKPDLSGGVLYQDEWVNHLLKRFGDARHNGVSFYAMDNEPDLWETTHTDIHPAQMGYDDVLNKFLEYSTAVKAVDPSAQVTGPVSWGWLSCKYSALDRGGDNFGTHEDSVRHGGGPFLLWFLNAVQAHDTRSGGRTLDVLDVHYYPQGSGLYGGAEDGDAPERRLRSTRSLWDRAYTDESWINEPISLIPRLKEWIAAGYPGTKIGITEWNFGADGHIDGALAIADTLGLYGREGVYLANYWAFPAPGSPGYLAFKLLRNADGHGHGFGDLSVRAVSGDDGRVASYAALDQQSGGLTLLLVNKMSKTTVTVPINFTRPLPGRGVINGWRLDSGQPNIISGLPAMATDGRSFTASLPPWSATLFRIITPGAHKFG